MSFFLPITGLWSYLQLLTAFMRTKSDATVADFPMCARHTSENYGFCPLKER